jgi:PAS domain S-box-containing protein
VSDLPTIDTGQAETIKILLVEDDDGCALLLKTVLTRWRYGAFNIQRADTLSAAVLMVAAGGVDIILLDLGLPDSQGLDTFVRMRAAAAQVPIIILSGADDETLAITMVQQGAQDYIVKGQVDNELLVRAIRYAIERWRTQRALAAERDLLRSVIDNIPDQVYLKDKDSRFVSVNPVTARFFGASSPAQIVGKSDFDYFPRELAEQFLAEEQALIRGDRSCVINRESAITDPAGNTQWVVTTKVPLRDYAGNITGLLGINHDITERKNAGDEILRVNAELEQRVNARTLELREAVAHLEEQDRVRAEFVSSVSHELKTPLTSMRFAIANLLEGVVGPVPDRVAHYLEMLKTDCQRMASTVEDILDLSRLESKTMRLHRVKHPFDRLIRQAISALSVQAQTKHLEVVLSFGLGLGFVECDALKTVRAIINILSNAIKFTPEGGRVEIGLHREDSFLVVDITDNGIGIPPQHLERISEKYFRVGEYISGTGLGLSITKEIIELHGGRMVIQSPPPGKGRGTRVSVSMPTVDPPVILMAVDDAPLRDLLNTQLCGDGYRVSVCTNQDEAIDMARRSRPDVGIIEVSPSVPDEEALIFRIKADQDLRVMPVVAVAVLAVGEIRQKVLNELGVPLLLKPWPENHLLDYIEAVIGGMALSK